MMMMMWKRFGKRQRRWLGKALAGQGVGWERQLRRLHSAQLPRALVPTKQPAQNAEIHNRFRLAQMWRLHTPQHRETG